MDENKTIYLIRHGQTKGNTEGNWLGSRSVDPLNEYGKKQARDTADTLKKRAVDASKIYSSPTPRALMHAEIIQHDLNFPIEKIHSITEMNLGVLEDKSRSQGIHLLPQEVKDWKENLKKFDPPLGETALESYERFSETVKLLAVNNPKRDVIFITHGIVIKLFLAKVLRESIETGEIKINVPWTRHGSISIFKFDGQGFKFIKVIENKYPDSKEVANFG